MCRLKNSAVLTTWVMVEGMSQIARGISCVGSINIVMQRYSLTYPTIFRKLVDLAPAVRDNNCWLLRSETALDTGFANFQLILNNKYQRDGSSAKSMHAIYWLAKILILVIPSASGILQVGMLTLKLYVSCNQVFTLLY